jgi:hypothetical protein
MTTKREAFEHIGHKCIAVDYAIPQTWLDMVTAIYSEHLRTTGDMRDDLELVAYDIIRMGFVWCYDDIAPTFGRPFPLTADARKVLKVLPMRLGGNCE